MGGLTSIALMLAPVALGAWSLYGRASRRGMQFAMILASGGALFMLGYRWWLGQPLVPFAIGVLASLTIGWGVFQRVDRAGVGRRFGIYRHVEQDSPYLHLRIDLIEGQVGGTVKKGRYAGRDFASLGREDLRALAQECIDDPASAWLMALSLKLYAAADGDHSLKLLAGAGQRPMLSIEQALDVLGLSPGSSAEEIAATYRRRVAELFLDRSANFDRLDQLDRARAALLGR